MITIAQSCRYATAGVKECWFLRGEKDRGLSQPKNGNSPALFHGRAAHGQRGFAEFTLSWMLSLT